MSCHVRLLASCAIVPFAFARGRRLRRIPLAPGAADAATAAAACSQAVLSACFKTVWHEEPDGQEIAYPDPDTLVGTDFHTTMVNGLGVLGWGVGGIEAEAAMLGQPVSMLIPDVVGFKLTGKLKKASPRPIWC